jgi:hypothetical protein
VSTEEKRARARARARRRFAEDTEFRERKRRYRRAYRAANKERIGEQRRRKWARNPELRERARARRRNNLLKTKYGISFEDYKAMLARQNGVCAICNKPPGPTRLSVDHDHVTRAVRQLLCVKCNAGLGCFDDDPDLLRAAIAYLEKHRGHR